MTTGTGPPAAAIIGAGLMGKWHAIAAVRAGARIAIVVDPDRAAASALAARFPGSRAAASIDGIDELTVSVAHVCTPVADHPETAGALLDAGVHVLVEKPLAASADASAALLARAAAAKRLLCPVHQFGFQRGVQRAIRAMRDIGPVLHFDFVICTAGASSETARRVLIESVLPHPLSLISHFLLAPVSGLDWHVLDRVPGELRAIAGAGSATVSILLSTSGRPTTNELTLICERGTIAIDLFHGFSVVEGSAVSRARKMTRPMVRSATILSAAAANLVVRAARRQAAFPGLYELTERFYRAVADGAPSPISSSEVMAIAVARDRILASAMIDR